MKDMVSASPNNPSASLLPWLVFAIGASTLAGAYIFQYVIGLAPCPLCLTQRVPYWIGLGAMMLAVFGPIKARWLVLLLGSFVFVAGAGLGVYHAGIEWRFWPGPETCSGGSAQNLAWSVNGLAQALDSAPRVVRCDEAPWHFLGLSLAGYNVLISLLLAALSALAARTQWVADRWTSS